MGSISDVSESVKVIEDVVVTAGLLLFRHYTRKLKRDLFTVLI